MTPRTLILSLLLLLGQSAAAEQERSVVLDEEAGVEMDLRIFPANGELLMLGFPCDQGTGSVEAEAAAALSTRGLEVWLADMLGAHFLPVAPSSMRSLQGEEVATLIDQAVRESDKPILLSASGYGAIPLLRGARSWQQRHPDSRRLRGAILLFPMLGAETPEPGKPMEYLPIVAENRLPLVILQPANTPGRFWVNKLKQSLASHGAAVHVEILPKVRGFFYTRRDATADEVAMTRRLPELFEQAIHTLTATEEGTK